MIKISEIKIFFSGKYPSENAGSKRIGLYKKGINEENIDCEIISTHISIKTNKLFFLVLYNIILPIKLFRLSLSKNSLSILYGYSWLSILIIIIILKIKKSKIFLEVNEKPFEPYSTWVGEIKIIKYLNKRMLINIVYPLLDGFIVISDELENYCNKYKSKQAIIIKIPILVDPTLDQLDIEEPDSLLEHPFIIHAGALSEKKDGITGLLEAFAIACKNLNYKIHFYFTDNTAPYEVKSKFEYIIEKFNLQNNVHFLGKIPQNKLLYYQKNSTMLVLFKPDNEQNRHNFSTKLGEFMLFSIPVIFTPVGEMTRFLIDGENALEVLSNDVQALSQKIEFLIQNPDKGEQIGRLGKIMAIEKFSYRTNMKRFMNILKLHF